MSLRSRLKLLILGGTTEAYDLAQALAPRRDLAVVTSLAGRTANPRRPAGEVRVGGFGGADGLGDYLRKSDMDLVIDATHPFASRMGWNAAAACNAAGLALLRLERPPWRPGPGDQWLEFDDWIEAATLVTARTARRVLLAVGRQELVPFSGIDAAWFLIRSVEAPAPMPPFRHAELLLARGPFTLEGEHALLAERRIDLIVCKNSGGTATDAKLAAARELGIAVAMKRRPARPGVPVVDSVAAALAWLDSVQPAVGYQRGV